MITIPDRERVTPGGHLKLKRKAVALGYLRAAHAYMLISMPTGTSTIFGAFQAILALSFFNFFNRTDSALADKLMRNEKFASEIFFKLALITFRLCCTAKGLHVFVRHDVKPTTDQALLSGIAFRAMLISVRIHQAPFRKELVR